MIGFELKSQKENISAGVEEGVTSVIFTRICSSERDEIHMVLGGTDKAQSKNLTWISRNILPGEEFVIKVSEFKIVSKPLKCIEMNSDNLILEGKLRAYHGLRKELEAAGMI